MLKTEGIMRKVSTLILEKQLVLFRERETLAPEF